DEACRIDATGAELSRVVKGDLADDADLSPDESNNPFFMPTEGLKADEVWYQTPYISPDTKRWVISVSTPLIADNQNFGIVHFEANSRAGATSTSTCRRAFRPLSWLACLLCRELSRSLG